MFMESFSYAISQGTSLLPSCVSAFPVRNDTHHFLSTSLVKTNHITHLEPGKAGNDDPLTRCPFLLSTTWKGKHQYLRTVSQPSLPQPASLMHPSSHIQNTLTTTPRTSISSPAQWLCLGQKPGCPACVQYSPGRTDVSPPRPVSYAVQ